MAERSYRWLLMVLAVIGFGLDQASKYAVFRSLYSETQLAGEYVLIPGMFRLLAQYDAQPATGSILVTANSPRRPHVNHGALFGIGIEHKSSANFFFACISFLAALAILGWLFWPSAGRDLILTVALGLILGGTLGNFFDRIVFDGVRDFLHFRIEGVIDWPVFNIADCCLVCGAGLLMIQALFLPPAKKPETTVAQTQDSLVRSTATTSVPS